MLLYPVAALLGVIAGYARRGQLANLAELRFGAPGVLVAALGVQVALGWAAIEELPGPVGSALLVASYAVAGGWMAANAVAHRGRVRLGLLLLAAGWALNLAAIAPNGAMPVSQAALEEVGAEAADVVEGGLEKHVIAGDDTALRPLGDVLPVAPLGVVLSVGDVAMMAGVATVVAAGMARAAPGARADEVEAR